MLRNHARPVHDDWDTLLDDVEFAVKGLLAVDSGDTLDAESWSESPGCTQS